MATRSTIRSQIRNEISQVDSTNSDYSDIELNGMIDEACTFIATLVDWPREFVQITPVAGTPTYDITAAALGKDTVKILTGYWGDPTVAGDVKPLELLTEQQLKGIYPNWLETATQNQGKPGYLIQKTKSIISIYPVPAGSLMTANTLLILDRVYYPSALASDSSVPDVPIAYHDFIKFYVAYLCYSGKLRNAELANLKLSVFSQQVGVLKPEVNRELEEQFRWGFTQNEGLDDTYYTLLP